MDDVVAVRTAPFVARAAELERLQQLSRGAADGSAAAVLLAGDAGVGKTSLIAESARRAAADGLLVLLGRCVDLGTGALPYQPFAEALSQLVRAGESGAAGTPESAAAQIVRDVAGARPGLARIAGGSGQSSLERAPGDTGLDRLALFEAVSHVLARIGDEVAPVLLVIEDLHWADASTRDLVRFLLARLGGDRLLVVASYRADDLHRRHPLRPLLGELLRLPQVERMDLAPFADAELADFLSAVQGRAVAADVLRQITTRSAGNAYYAEELLAAGTGDELPSGLADVLLDRLERLSPAGQQVIRVASVLGSARVADTLLRACAQADHEPVDVETGLREAVAHHLLVPDGPDRYAFRHALLQEAVYADLLPGERVRLHATAARQLSAQAALAGEQGPTDASAAELARHALAAHDLPLALAASLRAAAEAGRRSAPAEALAHYEEALQLWAAVDDARRPPDVDPVGIAIAAAAAAGDAGLHERAVALARSAVEEAQAVGDSASGRATEPDRARVARAGAALALHIYSSGDMFGAREQARRVVTDLDGAPPSPARVLARSIEARVDVSLSEVPAALEVIPPALAEAEELGLLSLQAELLTSLATAHGMAGRPDTEERWALAKSMAERAGDRAALIRVLYNTAIDRIDDGDLTGAVEAVTESLAVADAAGLGSSLYAAQGRTLLITIRWQMGDGDAAVAVARPDRRAPGSLQPLQLFALPVLAARDPERALADADRPPPTASPWYNQVLQTARLEALAWLGCGPEAADAATRALAHADADGEPHALVGISIATNGVAALADSAAVARERGDDAEVARLVERAEPLIEQARERARLGRPRRFTMGPEGLAWLARLDAEVARLHGSDDEAGWDAVARAFVGVSVYESARAGWRRAEQLARAGDRERARDQAREAHRAATRLGARPLIDALDGLARRGRFEVTKPSPENAVLTPREQDVMVLVGQGLTNRVIGERLFISEKTASVHVSNVLAKLGAASRAEAATILARQGLLP